MMNNLHEQHFFVHGYVHIKSVTMGECSYAVQQALTETEWPTSPNTAGPWKRVSSKIDFTPLHKYITPIAEHMIGEFTIINTQLCTRFPGELSHERTMGHWHVDNYTAKDMKRKHAPQPFDLLIGVVLDSNALHNDQSGNLVVYPRSHLQVAHHLRRHAANTLCSEEICKKNMLGDTPFQEKVVLRPMIGDLIVVHHLLAHTVAPNIASYPRSVVYFRLRCNNRPPDARPHQLTPGWNITRSISDGLAGSYEHLGWISKEEKEGHKMYHICPKKAKPALFGSYITIKPDFIGSWKVDSHGMFSKAMTKWLDERISSTLFDGVVPKIRNWDYSSLMDEFVKETKLVKIKLNFGKLTKGSLKHTKIMQAVNANAEQFQEQEKCIQISCTWNNLDNILKVVHSFHWSLFSMEYV